MKWGGEVKMYCKLWGRRGGEEEAGEGLAAGAEVRNAGIVNTMVNIDLSLLGASDHPAYLPISINPGRERVVRSAGKQKDAGSNLSLPVGFSSNLRLTSHGINSSLKVAWWTLSRNL